MPIKNQENTLEVSIDSVLNQTYKNFELIIVDDNSTDRSDEIVQKYAQKDKRIKLIKNQKEKGISESKNIFFGQLRCRRITCQEQNLDSSMEFTKELG